MEKEEQLKNSELQQQDDIDEMEGEDYGQDDFEDQQDGMDPEMDMEGEGDIYEDDGQDNMQNPYNPNEVIRNTFYPSQNPMMNQGYGGALRPVSANIMRGNNRRGMMRGKTKKSGFSKGIDDEFDVRTRPKNFLKDKEGLYDDAIKLKKANNMLK